MEEFIVKAAPKSASKRSCVFKMHKDDKVNWTEAKVRRENELQPWQIKLGSGRSARRFKAIKEGGVGENASYYIFYEPEGSSKTYEVCPIDDWFSMSATQRYKTLSAEEAEQKFEQRHKTLNMFSVMKKGNDGDEEGGSVGDSKAFKVSEMDDWNQSGDDFNTSDDGEADGESESKKKKKKSVKKEKDDHNDAPEEGKEDSDEGDFEQREVDYMSDSSSSSSEVEGETKDEANLKGITEEGALRDLLDSDEEEEASSIMQQNSKKFDMDKDSLGTINIKQDPDADGSDESSDSDDYDVDEDKMDTIFMKKSIPSQLVKQEQDKSDPNEGAQSGMDMTSGSPPSSSSATKRPISNIPATSSQPPPKRQSPPDASLSSQEKMVEDLVKKYLRRKPTQTKDLLKTISSKLKMNGAATSQSEKDMLVHTIALVIKRLDPHRQKINGTTYISLPN